MKNCPKCNLINPDSAQQCDCGWYFGVTEPRASAEAPPEASTGHQKDTIDATAYIDERVTVDVRESSHGEIIYRDPTGKEQTYYLERTVHLEIDDLRTLVALQGPREGETGPIIVRRLNGTARLDRHTPSISVIGDPDARTRTLEVSIEAGDWRPKADEQQGDTLTFPDTADLGGAMLGFNRADWEIDTVDQWFACCVLPQPFVEQLEAAIDSGTLSGVRVRLALRRLYSDMHDLAPPSMRRDLFIRCRDNKLASPETVFGCVASIAFTRTEAILRTPVEPEPSAGIEDLEPSNPPALPDPVAEAIASLAARIEATRSTIKWVGGLIVVALLFVAQR